MIPTAPRDIDWIQAPGPAGATRFYGNWTTISNIHLRWTHVLKNVECGVLGYHLTVWDHTGTVVNTWVWGVGDYGAKDIYFTTPVTNSFYDVGFFADSYCSGGISFSVTLDGGTTNPCPCGSEGKPSVLSPSTITGAIVDAAVSALWPGLAANELAVWLLGLDTMIGAPNFLDCTQGPPPIPTFYPDDYIAGTQIWAPTSFPKHTRLLGAAIWNTFCQCKDCPDGTHPPTPPNPVGPVLPTPRTEPRIVIDEHSISITIDYSVRSIQQIQYTCNQVSQTINNITNNIGDINDSVTNINNQLTVISGVLGLAYDLGTVHAGLQIEGQFSVPTVAPVDGAGTLVGLLVDIIADLPNASDQVGNPPYLWNRGWLSIDNPDGMLDEKRLTRLSQIWLPRGAPLATTFNWWLPPGLVINVTELVSPAVPALP